MFEPIGEACPHCGHVAPLNDSLPPPNFFRPWHILHGRLAVQAYVASLGEEAHEWLLALYVDAEYQLLAVDCVARGGRLSCPVPFWKLIRRGHQLNAAGYVLVHNHPSGDPRPSSEDIHMARRLEQFSRDAEMHLLNQLIVGDNDIWILA